MAQFLGKVIGTQMMKTAKVEVTRMRLHPHVLKVLGAVVFVCLYARLSLHSEVEDCFIVPVLHVHVYHST